MIELVDKATESIIITVVTMYKKTKDISSYVVAWKGRQKKYLKKL